MHVGIEVTEAPPVIEDNPGIGGTNFLFATLGHQLQQYSQTVDAVTVYLHKRLRMGGIPAGWDKNNARESYVNALEERCVSVTPVSGARDAVRKAITDACDVFIIRHPERDKESNQQGVTESYVKSLSEASFRTIVWLHEHPTTAEQELCETGVATRVVAVSTALQEQLVASFDQFFLPGGEARKNGIPVYRAYNFVDTSAYDPYVGRPVSGEGGLSSRKEQGEQRQYPGETDTGDRLRTNQELSDDVCRVVFVGDVQAKSLVVLAEAWAGVRERCDDVQLDVVGGNIYTGGEPSDVNEDVSASVISDVTPWLCARDGSVKDDVTFHGLVSSERKRDVLQASDVGVVAPGASNPTFSLAAVECQAAGNAVVGPCYGGIKETVHDGVTGQLFSVSGRRESCPQRISEVIQAVVEDDAWRAQAQSLAPIHAARFHPMQAVRDWDTVFNRVR